MSILTAYMAQQAQAGEDVTDLSRALFGTPKAFVLPFTTRSSHVRVAEDCLRKWYLNTVCDLPDNETEAKTFGTVTHEIYEHWFKDATPPQAPAPSAHHVVVRRSLHHYPAPGPGLLVEHKIQEVLADGTVYTGAIDLADVRKDVFLRLYDHKTCGSLKWAKTAETLQRDVSAVFYARRLLPILNELGHQNVAVPSRWVYSERNPNGKTMPVDFIIKPEHMRERWAKTLDTVQIMRRHAEQTPKWTDVTPNYDACGSYGGCRFQGQCNLARRQNNMGLLDNLRASLPVGQQVAQAPPPAPAPAQTGGVLASLLAKQQPAAQAVAALPVSPGLEEGMSVPVDPPPAITGVVPPDAPQPDLTKDTVEKKTRKKREKTMDAVPTLTTQQEVTQALGQGTIMAEAAADAIVAEAQQAMNQALAKEMIDAGTSAVLPLRVVEGLLAEQATTNANTERSEILSKIRKYAEDKGSVEIFVLANKLERGEL